MVELTTGLRREVLPLLGTEAGRAYVSPGAGGDLTFAIDLAAEKYLERFLRERAPGIAFYSEDRGLVQSERQSDFVLVVDPIDGTRPALAGLESCCVSVAAARIGDGEPVMADVEIGCIVEIKSGTRFLAKRGEGLRIESEHGVSRAPNLSDNRDLTSLLWSSGFRGRPASPVIEVLEELIDISSVGGAFFVLGSATFDMTRILTAQLDAYLEVGSLMIDELPALKARFQEVGGGAVLNNSPYDVAAAVLCLEEGGAVVTDADGRSLADRPLLGSGHEFQMSCVAAANPDLHSDLIAVVRRGIDRLLARST